MEEEHRGLALIVLGVISVIAVVGLVLMFSGAKQSTGALFTNVGTGDLPVCDSPCTLAVAGSDHDNQMQSDMFNRRGFYLAGQTQFTYALGAPEARTETVNCWCPTQNNAGPQFRATGEPESLVGYRHDAVPVDQYGNIQYPGDPVGQDVPAQERPNYPIGTNTWS
ncbi:hypothetical protein COV18_02005 [Candidatus Woesearchaeota archaeon CG10_big_fil_rev_8_21_14_0_10_37_12]|nr:MAG: hypothetical protein COV18_02005 [Candidatus Woesearchaeota archaeon CG10_big_fil_rev_8_21_14_0_10_37_12]